MHSVRRGHRVEEAHCGVRVMKACSKCKETKPRSGFYRRAASVDGLNSWCKCCAKKYQATWYKANPAKIAGYRTAQAEHNPGSSAIRSARWRKSHPGKAVANVTKYNKANPDKRAASEAARRARKFRATPAWNNEFDSLIFAEAYALAKAREKATRIKWHVDHIVPLRSRVVCGLHTGHNIQVMLAFGNQSKGNRVWPNMP